MKKIAIILPLVLLTACGPKVKLVPQVYMPAPPEILMRAPKDLNTIKPVPEQKEESKPETTKE